MVDKQILLGDGIEKKKDKKSKPYPIGYVVIFFSCFGLIYFSIFSFFYHFFPKVTDFWIQIFEPFTKMVASKIPGAVNVVNQLSEAGYADRIPLVEHSYALSLLLTSTAFIATLVSFPIGYFKGVRFKPAPNMTWRKTLLFIPFSIVQCWVGYIIYYKQEIAFNPVTRAEYFSAYQNNNSFMLLHLWVIPMLLVIILVFLIRSLHKLFVKQKNEPTKI